MQIFVVGMNHKSASVELRERFAFAGLSLDAALQALRQMPQFHESALLSTCNRTEIYGVCEAAGDFKQGVAAFLSAQKQCAPGQFEQGLYAWSGSDAVEHLFRVVCGLDSMILGEYEILGQVKKAYEKASAAKNTGKILNRLFQRSFHVGKAVRSACGNGFGEASVSSVAVELAKKIFGDLSGCKAMIVGAGQTGEQTVKHLMGNGVHSIIASNRSLDKARELAREFGGEAVTLDEAIGAMDGVDIVISCTAAPHVLFTREQVGALMKRRAGKPIFFIDIAVPRDIDAHVHELDNVFLYNIDDLQAITREKCKQREQFTVYSREAVAAEREKFFAWLVALGTGPKKSLSGIFAMEKR